MPVVIDGIDATIALRSIAPQAAVILVTAFSDDATLRRAGQSGARRASLADRHAPPGWPQRSRLTHREPTPSPEAQPPLSGPFRTAILDPDLLLAVAAGVILIFQVLHLRADERWVEYTDVVRADALALDLAIVSQDPNPDFDALRTLVADNPPQQARIDAIHGLYRRWAELATPGVRVREGREEMDAPRREVVQEIRTRMVDFIGVEDGLLVERLAVQPSGRRSRRWSRWSCCSEPWGSCLPFRPGAGSPPS